MKDLDQALFELKEQVKERLIAFRSELQIRIRRRGTPCVLILPPSQHWEIRDGAEVASVLSNAGLDYYVGYEAQVSEGRFVAPKSVGFIEVYPTPQGGRN